MTGEELRKKILAKRAERQALAEKITKRTAAADELGLDEDIDLSELAGEAEDEVEKKVVQGIKFDIVYDVKLNGKSGEIKAGELAADDQKALNTLFDSVGNLMNELSQQPSQVDKMTGSFTQTLVKNIEKISGKRNALVRTQVRLAGSADAQTSTATVGVVAMLTTFIVGQENLNKFRGVVEDAFKTTRFNCSQAIKRQVKRVYEQQVAAGKGIADVKSIDIAFKDVVNFDAAAPEVASALAASVAKKSKNIIANRLQIAAGEPEFSEVVETIPLFSRDELTQHDEFTAFVIDEVDYLDEDPKVAWGALADAGFTAGDEAVLPAGANVLDIQYFGGACQFTVEHAGHVLSIDLDEECTEFMD